MKTRSKASTEAVMTSRNEWPEPVELGPIRSASLAPGPRGMSEPPVRPIPGWRLPSGQLLVEYALRAGLASSPLLVRLPLLGGSWAAQALGGSEGRAEERSLQVSALAERVAASNKSSRRRPTRGSERSRRAALRQEVGV